MASNPENTPPKDELFDDTPYDRPVGEHPHIDPETANEMLQRFEKEAQENQAAVDKVSRHQDQALDDIVWLSEAPQFPGRDVRKKDD